MVSLSARVSELDLDDFAGQLTQTLAPNISWQTYRARLADMGDRQALHYRRQLSNH